MVIHIKFKDNVNKYTVGNKSMNDPLHDFVLLIKYKVKFLMKLELLSIYTICYY